MADRLVRAESIDRSMHPLFQADEGGSIPTSALRFFISPVAHSVAESWIEQWHYSHRMPTGKNIPFALWDNHEIYAVIVYGIGVNPYQAKFLGVETVLEIKRMARSEPRLDYPLSRFISITIGFVRKQSMVDAIIAFADPEQGHEGTVYKAAGFKLEGKSPRNLVASASARTFGHRRRH